MNMIKKSKLILQKVEEQNTQNISENIGNPLEHPRKPLEFHFQSVGVGIV